jgi:hypothetical protein
MHIDIVRNTGSKGMDGCHLTIMWTPIYGRLGDRRLGTVILCILFVD